MIKIRRLRVNKFVIVGVESTGKSQTSEEAAAHFDAWLVPEYARTYLDVLTGNYTYNDFLNIVKGQAQVEDEAVEKVGEDQVIIFDTDFIVIHIWAEIVFGKIDPYITERLNNQKERIYFLMSPEVTWIDDGMREYPELKTRIDIHQKYIDLLEELSLMYFVISGTDYDKRTEEVIRIISEIK